MARYSYIKYKDNKSGSLVVKAISHYAGKPICGVARCNPDDKYLEEDGVSLSTMRCDMKVLDKREKAYKKLIENLSSQIDSLTNKVEKYKKSYQNIIDMKKDLEFNLHEFEIYIRMKENEEIK